MTAATLPVPRDAAAASAGRHPLNNGGTHGKHGQFTFRDTSKTGTGVACHYSRGQLMSVTLASPLAAGRGYWLRGQYIPWKGKLERKQGKSWRLVAVGHGDDSKPVPSKVLTSRPPMTIRIKHGAPAADSYRVVEKLLWIANLPGGPEEGYAKHVIRHYHFGFGDKDRPFCQDATPTLSAPKRFHVVGGHTLNLDAPGLLAYAHQANHDSLRAVLVSVTEDGRPWAGATLSRDGQLQVVTAASDIGKAVIVRYRVVDAAGRTSTPAAVTINVTTARPTATDQSFGPATSGQALSVPAPGLLTGAGSGLTVNSVSNVSFAVNADRFSWSPDGSFTITPSDPDVAAGSVTFDYVVRDPRTGETSAPATATIEIAPIAADHEFDGALPGQSQPFQVDAPGLLADASGPGLSVGSISDANFDITADQFQLNPDLKGGFSITPQLSEASTTLTFTYTVINSDHVESAPATVTIPVGAAN